MNPELPRALNRIQEIVQNAVGFGMNFRPAATEIELMSDLRNQLKVVEENGLNENQKHLAKVAIARIEEQLEGLKIQAIGLLNFKYGFSFLTTDPLEEILTQIKQVDSGEFNYPRIDFLNGTLLVELESIVKDSGFEK